MNYLNFIFIPSIIISLLLKILIDESLFTHTVKSTKKYVTISRLPIGKIEHKSNLHTLVCYLNGQNWMQSI